MKSASTPALTEYILYDVVNGSRTQPTAKLEYFSDDSVWTEMDDVESLNVSNTNINNEYGKFKLIPGSNTANANFDNFGSKYSPNTGFDFDGVMVRNRKVKALIGYVLPVTTESTYTYSGTGLTKYHTDDSITSVTGGDSFVVLPNVTGFDTLYDSETYDDSTYTKDGYFLSEVIKFDRYDELEALNITSDNVNLEVYYRSSIDRDQLDDNLIDFISLGNTINGTQEYDLNSLTDRYFQFVIVWDTNIYGTGIVSAITIDYIGKYERFDQGEFLMDDPAFTVANGSYKTSFSARDVFKKAYETNVTCPSYTSATDIAEIMRDACDRAGLPHNDGSELISDTGYTVIIADDDNFKNVKCIDVLDECMFYLNAKDINYRLERSGGNIQLVIKSDVITDADWQLDYRYNLISLSKKYNSNKLLQRVTVLSQDEIVDPEIQLATNGYTVDATGITLSWSNDAMYSRITTSGTGTMTLNEVDLENNLIDFDLSGVSGAFTVTIFGDELANARTAYFGESIYLDNQLANDGITHKITNRLIQSDQDAQDIADGVIVQYGNQTFEVTATINCNPLLELGDKLLIWEKFSNTNTIYRVDNIGIPFTASGASLKQTLKLTDLGIDPITPYIWDRNGATTGTNDIDYDKGLLWDQDLGTQITSDPNTYTPIVRY